MAGDWKSRAVPVSTNDWKARAAPVDQPPGVAAIGVPNGPTPAAEDKDWTDAKIPGTEISARNVGQGIANALPVTAATAGGIGAGLAATPETLGMGAIPAGLAGAAAGGAAGNSVKRMLERYFDKTNDAGYKAPLLDQLLPRSAGSVGKAMAQGLGDVGEGVKTGLENETGGQVAGKVLPVAIPYLGQQFTGIPADTIKAYMENGPEALAQYGAAGKNLGRMADRIRNAMMDKISQFRGEQNQAIDKTLGAAGERGDILDIGGPIRNMETGLRGINAEAYPSEAATLEKALNEAKAVRPKYPSTKEPYDYGVTPVERVYPKSQSLELPSQQSIGQMTPVENVAPKITTLNLPQQTSLGPWNPVEKVEPKVSTVELPDYEYQFDHDPVQNKKRDWLGRDITGQAPTIIREPGGFQRSAPTQIDMQPQATGPYHFREPGGWQRSGPVADNVLPQSTGPIQYQDAGSFQKAGPWAIAENHVPADKAYEIKRLLQDHAKGSYAGSGDIFNPTGAGASTIKNSAAKLRMQIHDAYPEVGMADTNLSRLHMIDEQMKASLHTPGQATGQLSAAGAGTNLPGRNQLEDLGLLIGQDLVTPARNLSVAQQFGKTNLLPVDSTGKAVLRTGILSKAGGVVGGILGQGMGNVGATAGAAMSSPLLVKKAIDLGITNPIAARAATAGGVSLSNRLLNALSKEKKNGQ